MTTLRFVPPHAEVLPRLTGLPNTRIAPVMLAIQEGPERHRGPEDAGAILMLSMTFADEAKARGFWEAAAPLMELLGSAPGFIRRFTFGDDPCFYLIALWRTAADARAFAESPEHRAAVKALYRDRWQYSHFAAIWENGTPTDRIVFCDRCDAITPMREGACSGCGETLANPFAASGSRA